MKRILSVLLIAMFLLQSFVFVAAEEETRLWLTLDSIDLKTGSYNLVTENGDSIAADNTSTQTLSPGESAWLTINENNDITAIEKIPYFGFEFGYMTSIISGTYSSGAEYLRITVYKNGKSSFDLISEIILNGEESNFSNTYSVLSDYEGAIAYKYDSDINKITELYTFETPMQSISDAAFNPETGSFDMLNYPLTSDTITIFTDGKGSYSSITFEEECLYSLSVYGYDKEYNAKFVVVNEINYSDILFYKGEITAKSGNKYYINAYDENNVKKSFLLSNTCTLNGQEYNDIPSLYEEFGSFEGLIELSSDTAGSINKINTLKNGTPFKNIEYNANANIIGEYNLKETNLFMVKDIYKSGENTFNTVHKWNNMDTLSEDYTYSGIFYDTICGKYLWINDKSPVSGYLPDTKYGIRYNKESKIFTAFINANKNSYNGDATIIVCAYENNKLIDSDYISTKNFTDDTKYLTATCTLTDGKSLKDYTFKYFMFDEKLKTIENYPVFTGNDAAENDERNATYISGVVISNGIISADSNGGTDINLDAVPEVRVQLINTHGSTHPEFIAYADYTEDEMESVNFVKKFLVGNSDVNDYVGKKVNLWLSYNEITTKFIVLDCELDTTTNETVEFTLDQFASYDIYKGIEYYKDGVKSKTTAKLQDGDDTVVIYNNLGLGEGKIDDIFGAGNPVEEDSTYGGKVTLINNDTKSGYDVIFVEIGATAVVDEVSGNRILFKESAVIPRVGGSYDSLSSITVDETATDEIVKIFKGKKEISVSELSEWDVLSITAASRDADYIICEAVEKTIEGTISGLVPSNTSGAYDYSGNGIAYKIGNTIYDVAANAYKADNLQTGDIGLFYIDKYGKIVSFKEYEDPTTKYGFVLNAAMDTAGVNDGVFQIKLLTESGEKLYDFATKVSYYYNGTPTRTTVESDTLNASEFLAVNKHQLIKYTTNASGEINTIYEAGYDEEKFNLVRVENSAPAEWDAENLTLGRQTIDEDAKVLYLCTTHTYGTGDLIINGYNYDLDTSNSYFGTIADLEDGGSYNYIAYLTSSGDDTDLLVITTGYASVSSASNIAVITYAYTAQNDNFEDVYVLSYYKDGELHEEVMTTNAVYVENQGDLNVGDIVKIKTINSGEITGLTKIVDFDNDIRNSDGTIDGPVSITYTSASEKYDFNYATSYTKSTKTVTLNGISYRLSNAKNVYVIDPAVKSGKVDVGTASDFEYDTEMIGMEKYYADYVFARMYEGKIKEVVIVKGIFDDPESEDPNYDDNREAVEAKFEAEELLSEAEWYYEDEKIMYEEALSVYEYWLYEYEYEYDTYYVEYLNEAIEILKSYAESYKTAAEEYLEAAENYAEYDSSYDISDVENAYNEAIDAYNFAYYLDYVPYAIVAAAANIEVISEVDDGSEAEEVYVLEYINTKES